ncbi:transposase [Frankia sp. Ag45/Mut15]|uniref:Transposase n=1 Tax=Frankia umida TaxID=573489 RepID=A0ABT0K3W3_9ACTN|nr:transposase [Frankia umida]
MKTTALYPSVRVDAAGRGIVSHAGGLMLTETVRASGLGQALSVALGSTGGIAAGWSLRRSRVLTSRSICRSGGSVAWQPAAHG